MIVPSCIIDRHIFHNISAVVMGLILSTSGGIPCGPAAFPFFSYVRALTCTISALDGGRMLTFNWGPPVLLISGITDGGGLFNMSWKCSAHLCPL